jgi:hypothetical protein
MTYSEKVKHITAKVDIGDTNKYYESQIQFVENCSCEECTYYQNEFLNIPFSIFILLNDLGVDLRKHIDSEADPEGLWVTMDKGILVYCHSTYKLIGNFINVDNDFFETIENEYQITIELYKNNDTSITIFLTFKQLND